ncbi:acyl-CoA dehydrogenase family protein [Nocardia sp. NPDC059228]|uniref:acyl-CoA dehydrogenase family protein n=1 Tax=Nocardia sp. NPDC059228 TaxID=3346777 RepID=UPI003687E282
MSSIALSLLDWRPDVLTQTQKEIQDLARTFTHEQVLPVANQLDQVDGAIPDELIAQMAEMGFFGILIPEQYGGLGLGVFEYCLIAEELARGWMSVASLIARGNGLLPGFTEEQRRLLLPKVARGEYLGAFALSENEAGSDVANISCRAVQDNEDWVITGSKMWCTFADRADYILLFARTSASPDAHRRHIGISIFLIDKERGGFPDGINATPVRKIGYRGWKTWEMTFDGLRLPASAMLGEEGRGFYAAMTTLDTARAHTAARSIGLAQGALEDAIAYAQQREQFGSRIADFQAIRFKIADMATRIEVNRQMMHQACRLIDSREGSGGLAASMAKLSASEMSEWVTSQGLQIHGGAGYTTDFAAERYWRDARLTKIFEGTSEIQMKLISDKLLAR